MNEICRYEVVTDLLTLYYPINSNKLSKTKKQRDGKTELVFYLKLKLLDCNRTNSFINIVLEGKTCGN